MFRGSVGVFGVMCVPQGIWRKDWALGVDSKRKLFP